MSDTSVKILVVDDERDVEMLIRQKFRKQIKENKYSFLFACDGLQALETIRRDPQINIVMTDINMPVMDGLTLLSRLSELNRLLKIVIVSAYGDMRNIRMAMNRGAYDFLIKPIDFQDCELTIQKTIQELHVRQEGQRAQDELMALQNELGIATRIQQSMLPRTFPPFPERKDFEIYAEMMPARSVGGDFYDFFLLDEDRLGFVIGDVSGKGVPAAIFMAVCRTLLRATAMQGMPPGECLEYANTLLKRQSEAAMFVTIFYGILDTRTGEVNYSAGGHNPPYMLSRNGGVTLLECCGGTLVGAFDQTRYETGAVRLCPGDGIFLYTDGVTEADDDGGRYFSEERLSGLLEQVKARPVRQIVRDVIGAVQGFSAGAAQADDITVMALRYLPADGQEF